MRRYGLARPAAALLLILAAAAPPRADIVLSPADRASDALAHEIYRQLIEINTTDTPAGNVTTAAQAMQKRFQQAGFPQADIALMGASDRTQNLVVRLHGSGKHRPVLLIGHLDVVEARREDWSTDPFKLIEKDGFFYGRGSLDMKSPDAIMVATLLRMKQERFVPKRDIILALTANEESGCCNGVAWLLNNQRRLIDAQFVVNQDEVSVLTDHGKPQYLRLVASEKLYADYQLTVTNKGGHSSLPVADNAIYTLSRGLSRLAAHEFPFELNNVTRAYFEHTALIETGQRAADMRAIVREPPEPAAIARLSHDVDDSPLMRTTCVATRLAGGHANNALPQRAEAVVNCRILPGHSPEEIRQVLIKVLAEPAIAVGWLSSDGKLSEQAPAQGGFAPPPLLPEFMAPLQQVVGQMWPKLEVIPSMSAGASDAVYTSAAGLPTYTFSGLAVERDGDRSHGRDERLGVAAFYRGNEFFYRFLRLLTER
jgi:acetylornithine deacetylase/succinyl-diaminopimelate desuccinylase-like protein